MSAGSARVARSEEPLLWNEKEYAPFHPGLSPLSSGEWALLDILREGCQSFAIAGRTFRIEPDSRTAVVFGMSQADDLVQALMRYLISMSRTRRSTFSFSNPDCVRCRERITGPEARMLNVLRATAAGRKGEASIQAMLLCDGISNEDMLDEAARVVAVARRMTGRGVESVGT